MRNFLQICTFIFTLLSTMSVHAQTLSDSSLQAPIVQTIAIDTLKKYSPRKAIVRSAILPGWGQATNKKYWKIPLVYGALGTTTYLFFRNLQQYNDARSAYILAVDADPSNDYLIKEPYYTVRNQPERIRVFRNQVRQNIDYTVLFFIGFWGLNVVDAAVDAHLKTFDVSDKLSINIKAGFSEMARTGGFSCVVNFK